MNRINFPARENGIRIGADHLKYLQQSIQDEITNRAIRYMSPGIVTTANPTKATSPLYVTLIAGVGIQISPGSAMLDNGELVIVSTAQTLDLPLDEREYVVALRAADTPFNPQVSAFEETINTLIRTDFALALVPSSQSAQLADSELLATYSVANGVQLTSDSLTLRRWSSTFDWQHRGMVGAGQVTDSNPHGTTLFDQALNESVGAWSVLGQDGVLIAGHDPDYPNVRGKLIKETINPQQWTALSGDTWHAAPLRYAMKHLHSIRLVSNVGVPLPIVAMPTRYRTKAAMAGGDRSIAVDAAAWAIIGSAPVEVRYFIASSGNLAVNTSNPYQIDGLGTEDYELVLVDGKATPDTLSSFDLSDRAKFPTSYEMWATADGLALYPNVLVKSKAASAMVDEYDLTQNFDTPCTVRLVLGNTSSDPNMSLSILVAGKDSTGTDISETVKFTSSWADTNTANFLDTVNQYSQLTSLKVTDSTLIDLNAVIQVQNLQSTAHTLLATFDLTHTGIANLYDARAITQPPLNADESSRALYRCDNLFVSADGTPNVTSKLKGSISTVPFTPYSQNGKWLPNPVVKANQGTAQIITCRLIVDGQDHFDHTVEVLQASWNGSSVVLTSLVKFTGLEATFNLGAGAEACFVVTITGQGRTNIRGFEFI